MWRKNEGFVWPPGHPNFAYLFASEAMKKENNYTLKKVNYNIFVKSTNYDHKKTAAKRDFK